MFLGFQSPGLSKQWLANITVLQVLLGSGSVFSSGGPGKGMYSLLNKAINGTGFISDIKAHNLVYKDTGLFGIEATSLNNH